MQKGLATSGTFQNTSWKERAERGEEGREGSVCSLC